MAVLTEEQEKKLKKAKPFTTKGVGIKPGDYAPGSPGPGARRIQATQPSVGEIAEGSAELITGAAGEAKKRLIDPLTEPFKSAGRATGEIVRKAGQAVGEQREKREAFLTGGAEGVANLKARRKAGTDLAESIKRRDVEVGGQTSLTPTDPVTPSTSLEPSATDTGRDEQVGVPTPPTADTRTVTTGVEGQPGFGKITVAKGARRAPVTEAEQRFRAPVARPATRAERGLIPVGPNNSGQGYGARRSDRDTERRIEPPRSPGDRLRYRREIRERDKERELTAQQERTDIARTEATERTDIAGQRLAGEQEQRAFERDVTQQDRQKLQSLQEEFANPETTDARRSMIEREIGVMEGKPVGRERPGKSLEMTENQRANLDIKLHKEYDELAKTKGGFLGYGGKKPTYDEWLAERHPDLAADFGTSKAITREGYDAMKSGDTYVGADGRTYRKP